MSRRFGVVCLGSVKVDVVTELATDLDVATGDAYDVAPIEVRLGGTAGTFCRAARDHFASVGLIAALGDDAFTAFLTGQLEALGVKARLQTGAGAHNGVVLSIRHGPAPAPRRRLMIASRDSAHLRLSPGHVESCRDLIQASDALVCDAYALRAAQSRAAVLAGMRIANEEGVPVVFDLVPHSLPATTPLSAVLPFVVHAQIVVAEARTIVGLVENRWPLVEPPDRDLADRAVEYAQLLHPATWLIRFGAANIETTVRLEPDGSTTAYSNGHPHEYGRWGFGDRLLVTELQDELTRRAPIHETTARNHEDPRDRHTAGR